MTTDHREHAPLSQLDEWPIHQSNEPLRLVSSTDPRTFERYWFTAQDDDGDIFVVAGIDTCPNIGTVDAYAIIVTGGRHTTVRAYRPMRQQRTDLSVGPLRFGLIEAFRHWHLVLGANDQDFTFDQHWHDTKRAMFCRLGEVQVSAVLDFRLLHNRCCYETFGRISGTVRYLGRTSNVKAETARGSRDHHWGHRDGVGGYKLDHVMSFTSYKGECAADIRTVLEHPRKRQPAACGRWQTLVGLGVPPPLLRRASAGEPRSCPSISSRRLRSL